MIAAQPTLDGSLPLVPPMGGEGVPDFDERRHRYTLDGEWLPGVTTILGVLDKPALPWWGMQTGVRGIVSLIDRGLIEVGDGEFVDVDGNALDDAALVKLLTTHKLTVNHVKESAGARGSIAHDQLERHGRDGTPIRPAKAPEEVRGYVRSAALFLAEFSPEFLANEVMVWSPTRWFAGTFDAIVRIDGELWMIDYKTSKRVYESHHLQLAAYEGARRELGLEPIEHAGVVLLPPDGGFNPKKHFVESVATFEDFLGVKGAYDAMSNLKTKLAA